ncbi:MAG: hypothetical protein DSY90_12830 [Deltaproteobacteria bacterium]|nr:MAG: hypothetical protein DSY90_12830 [Deltaproteobacteria bacterium]
MSAVTRVYLITGFLGSGKTTLLNRILDRFPRDKKLALLVNEFGEIGIDGTLLEAEDYELMEISKGSIFCVCVKTDFIKGLYTLSTTVQPHIMIIESTGVANPSDLKKDLVLPIFNNRFRFMTQFCMIDAVHFLDAYEVYSSIEKQIASSSVFIINKTDLAPPEKIAATKKVIRQFHPDPFFFETTYADIPIAGFFEFDAPPPRTPAESPVAGSPSILSADALDVFLDQLFDDPGLQLSPPDLLESVVYRWTGGDLGEIKKMAGRLPSAIVRAKGFIVTGGDCFLFNFVMGDWSIERAGIAFEKIRHQNTIVFIGPPDSIVNLKKNLSGTRFVIHPAD